MRARKLFPFVLMIAAIAACGGRAANNSAVTGSSNIRVVVRNDSFYDATVYLVRGGARQRVGTATAASTSTFNLPRQAIAGLSEIRFIVDFIGRRDNAASESILAQPGDEINLIIR